MDNLEPLSWQLNEIVTEAGTRIRQARRSKITIDRTQPDNVTTNVESELIQFYKNSLPQIFEAPVFGEEIALASSYPEESIIWMVDVIDGTLSYLNGYDGYVTQACLMINNNPVVSAVYAPETNELFHAILGLGSYWNSKRLKVKTTLENPTFIDNTPKPNLVNRKFMNEMKSNSYIESGSIGLKICRVASGEAHIFIKATAVSDWDVAPGGLILNEAGGHFSLLDGRRYSFSDSFNKPNFLATCCGWVTSTGKFRDLL